MGNSNSWPTITDMYFESEILQSLTVKIEFLQTLLKFDKNNVPETGSYSDEEELVTDEIVEYCISKSDTEFDLSRCSCRSRSFSIN